MAVTDRSLVIMEVYPGAAAAIDRLAEEGGGWVCEQHPDLPFEHDDCPGPGMIHEDAVRAYGVCSFCGASRKDSSHWDLCKVCATASPGDPPPPYSPRAKVEAALRGER